MPLETEMKEKFTQTTTPACKECVVLQKENRLLRNQLINEKQKLGHKEKNVANLKSRRLFGLI